MRRPCRLFGVHARESSLQFAQDRGQTACKFVEPAGGRAQLIGTRTANLPREASMEATFVKTKHVAFAGAASAYVAAGYVAFQLVHAASENIDFANTVVAALAIPLALPLYAALRWIDRQF